MKNRRSSVDREERLGKGVTRASVDSTDLSRLPYEKQPKWYRASAANARTSKNGRITVGRICLGAVAGVVALIALLAASGVVYTKCFGPARWESEGWYPSRKSGLIAFSLRMRILTISIANGGTVKNWEESYKKAAKLVGQLSLVEKVNITTGVGWAQGFCVGMSSYPITDQFNRISSIVIVRC